MIELDKDLTRESLAEQVANSLRDYIYASLETGDFLPATANLAKEYGVSRIVIREALKILEAQDIIDVANGRRAQVKPLSANVLRNFFRRASLTNKNALMELLEVRRGIEIESAQLAAQRRTPEELAQMKTIVEKMKVQVANPEAFANLDLEFHQIMATATRNAMLFFLVDTIRDEQKETILAGLRSRFSSQKMSEIVMIHEEIVAAMEEQDAKKAQQSMTIHFDYAEQAVGYEPSEE